MPKFPISSVDFVSKVNCLRREFRQQFPVLTVKSCGKFQQNLNSGFEFSLPKSCKTSWSRQEGENVRFHQLVLSER